MSSSESTAIRGKDWIFNAFWAATLSQSSSHAKCSLNIPITALFKDGVPVKVLATNTASGLVEKINILDDSSMIALETDIKAKQHETGFRGSSLKNMNNLRVLLINFSNENGYYDFQLHQQYIKDPFICKV
jgi:hypothetical protein